MSTDQMVMFVEQRPFEPFTMFLADGRQLDVADSEFVSLGLAALSVTVVHRDGQVEVFDTALVVSIRSRDRSN